MLPFAPEIKLASPPKKNFGVRTSRPADHPETLSSVANLKKLSECSTTSNPTP